MFLLIEIMNVYGTTRKDSRGSGERIRAVAERKDSRGSGGVKFFLIDQGPSLNYHFQLYRQFSKLIIMYHYLFAQ